MGFNTSHAKIPSYSTCECCITDFTVVTNLWHTDVRLCLDDTNCNNVIPNNTILHPGNLSSRGLLCVSSLEENGIGNWFNPNGERIIEQPSSVFYSLQRIRHVGLFRGGAAFTSPAEGVYTCRIPDGNRVQQLLYVGIYQTSTYMNSGK